MVTHRYGNYEITFLPNPVSIWDKPSEFRTIIIRKIENMLNQETATGDTRTVESLTELLDREDIGLDAYTDHAVATAVYGVGNAIVYPALGLGNEAGEVQGKIKKVLRDNNGVFDAKSIDGIVDEMGDVLWYLAALARDMNVSLTSIAKRNLQKLADRKARNKIQGSGDNR